MTDIHLSLNNFNCFDLLLGIFPRSEKYEFTVKKIFRLKYRKVCGCGFVMVHNGYDYARKKGFGKVKIGKQRCSECGCEYHEDKSFWKDLLAKWKDAITDLVMVLRDSDVGWQTISNVMRYIIPCSKDKARYLFDEKVEKFEYPQSNYLIINYDEQHPKRGRFQKFRLTLLNYETKVPIAEELFDNKNEETVEKFLRKHLDTERKIIIITDCDRKYPKIFKRIWGDNVVHQKCLLHLNKLVVKDFGKKPCLQNMYNKYLLLNIFYNRKKELKFLEKLLKQQASKNFSTDEKEWLKKAKEKFYKKLRVWENRRRRKGKNLTQRKLYKAKMIFEKLWKQKLLFPQKSQERLKMIKKNWKLLTAFHHVKGCPATNNAIENYYSTSLKTHRKKQLRTDQGITNHMKLTAIKRSQGLKQPKKTLLEIYGLITLITT